MGEELTRKQKRMIETIEFAKGNLKSDWAKLRMDEIIRFIENG